MKLLWICRDMCHTFIWNLAWNIHLKSFYKTFTQWQSRMKRFACRTSHGNPPDVRRRPADDPPMIVRCVFHRGIPVRESADLRTEARRTPADLMAIFWYTSAGTSRDVRADILRCPSDAKNSLQQFPDAVPMCRHRQYWPGHRTAAGWFVTVALPGGGLDQSWQWSMYVLKFAIACNEEKSNHAWLALIIPSGHTTR